MFKNLQIYTLRSFKNLTVVTYFLSLQIVQEAQYLTAADKLFQ